MAVVAAWTSLARALELIWQAPDECPTSSAVHRDVRRLAGASEGTALVAHATVSQTADKRWQVAIDLTGSATGHRTLTADNCAQLARATALIIALSANPDAALDLPADEASSSILAPELSPTAQQPVASTSTPAATASTQADAPKSTASPARPKGTEVAVPTVAARDMEPASPKPATNKDVPGKPLAQRRRSAADVFMRGGIASGALPTRTLWVGAGARARVRGLPMNFGLGALVTQTTQAVFTNGVGARFRLAAAQGRMCVEPWSRTLVLEACGGLQLTWMWAQGYVEDMNRVSPNPQDTVTSMNTNRWGLAPFGTLGLGLEIATRWTLEAGCDLILPTRRWEYYVDDNGPRLFRPEAVQYLLYLGVGYRLN